MARPSNPNSFLESIKLSPNFTWLEKNALSKTFRRVVGKSLAANVSYGDTTYADVEGITFNLETGAKYRVEGKLLCLGDTTGGIKAQLSATGQTTPTVVLTGMAALASSNVTQRALTGGVIFAAAGVIYSVDVSGYYVADGNGTLTLQCAQHADSGTTVLYAGSYIKLIRVG